MCYVSLCSVIIISTFYRSKMVNIASYITNCKRCIFDQIKARSTNIYGRLDQMMRVYFV